MQLRFLCLICLSLLSDSSIAEQRLVVGEFSAGRLENWEAHEFEQLTDYRLVEDGPGNRVLKAEGRASASGLYHKQRIDLEKTPFMHWRWKVVQPLSKKVQERTKAGDDYVARLYVLVDGGLRFWQTKSINYVWASNLPQMTVWPNAYAGNSVMMLALRAREAQLNTWYNETRNVREDFKQLMGQEFRFIDAVALMTDTDNSREAATALYGDIYFSDQ